MEQNNKRAVAYIRVSTEKQDLERQRSLANDYCRFNGYTLVDTIEEKISGTVGVDNRDSLIKLLSLSSSDCDLVIVSEISRMTREDEYYHIINYIDSLRKHGINVVFLDDPNKIYEANGEPLSIIDVITLTIKAHAAADERKKIRDRMKTGRVVKLQQNPYMVTGSQIPFGYEKYSNPNYVLGQTPKSLIRINEREAAVIRICYDMAINGNSCQRIADYLNASGFVHNNNKGIKLWAATEVSRMLKNRLYIGERVIEGVMHNVTPIVSVELFNMANDCITQRRCMVAKKQEHFNPLKGLFFCGDCGLPMSIVKGSNGREAFKCLYRTYVSKSPNKKFKPCHSSYVYVDRLLQTVWDLTVERLQTNEYYGQSQLTIKDYSKQMKSVMAQYKRLLAEYNEIAAEIRTVLVQLDKLTDPYLLNMVEERYKTLKQQEIEKQNEMTRLGNLHTDLENKIQAIREEITIDNGMTIYQKAEFFNKVLARVEWDAPKFKRYGKLTITFKNGDVVVVENMPNK